MAPKKDETKSAGPAETSRIVAASTEMEAKFERIRELKARFAGVGKALRPALVAMARRTVQRLSRPTYHQDGRRKGRREALVAELEKVRDWSVGRRVANYETQPELKAVSVQHDTLQEIPKSRSNIENSINRPQQKKVDEIRESSLNQLRLSYMTKMVQTANGTGADLENLGQGSNKRALRRPDPDGNYIARYKDTKTSANQDFYWSSEIMWDDWRTREHADPEMASQGRILPRPFDFIQAEMIESGAGGHRVQLHSEKEEKRPDSSWIGGMGKLPYFEAEEGKLGMA